jgi:hypothetical protein
VESPDEPPPVESQPDQVAQVLMPNGPPSTPEDKAQLLELYKLMVQSSEALVARRLGTNTFFLAVNGSLVAAIGLFVRQGADARSHGLVIAIFCLAGFIVAGGWHTLLISFGQLNEGKFAVIFRLEKVLPAAVFDAEWEALKRGTDKKRYRTFTANERRLPLIFMTIYGCAFVIGCLIALDWFPLP